MTSLDNPVEVTPTAEPAPVKQPNWKLYFFVCLGLLLMTAIGGGVTYKQTLSITKTSLVEMTRQKLLSDSKVEELTMKSMDLKQQVEKERSKNKTIRDFSPTGVLTHEETLSSTSSESRISELQEQVNSYKFERDLLVTDNTELKKELALKVDKETEKRDPFTIDAGGLFDIGDLKFKPSVGVSKTLLSVFGISLNLRLGASR